MQLIFLVGMPASGKTSLGKQLSKKLDYAFVDLDKEIVKEHQQSIGDIFALKGEEGFRILEKEMLTKRTYSSTQNTVIATGGGTPCFYENMALMNAAGFTIYIEMPISELCKRLQLSYQRPLINMELMEQHVEELFLERKKYYEQARFTLKNTPRKLEEAVAYLQSQNQ